MHVKLRVTAVTAVAALVAACGSGGAGGSAPALTVGEGQCCADPSCERNVCAPSLHCGSGQWPRAVLACCADGKVCCKSDGDCAGFRAGGACDLAHAACFEDCAGDDRRCTAGYHCDGNACIADLTDASTCDEATDCASRNCSLAFDPAAAASLCAPAGACAAGNASWPAGYTLCAGHAYARRCDAAGRWGAPVQNPQPAIEACDAGAGAASGYRSAASCTSGDAAGAGFALAACTSCAPYRATAAGCMSSCADDGACSGGYHCDGGTCVADLANASVCDEASDCATGNCSAAFDPGAAASVCAPAGTCVAGDQSWPVGYTLCSGTASARRCDAAGRWSAPAQNPHPSSTTCDAGGGAASGYEPAATCTSGLDAVDPGFAPSCVSCEPYFATSTACVKDCGDDDRRCWTGYHCAAIAGNVCVSNGYNSPCDVDAECTSGRCDANRCMPKLTNGPCTRPQDCLSGRCALTVDAAVTGTFCVAPGNTAPASCAAVKALVPAAADGTYRIFVGADWAKPWLVDCVDMATATPLEYLAVRQSDAAGAKANWSQYTDGGCVEGEPVVTRFSKVRIDPATLIVTTGDLRFSTSTGALSGWNANTSMAWAAAADCACEVGGAASGVANVDLTGTPFAAPREVDVGGARKPAWVPNGGYPTGTASYSSGDKVVSLTGGGGCGVMAPAGALGPSYGGAGTLPLVYVGW